MPHPMPALWIETPRARLRLESERLLLTIPGEAGDPETSPSEHHIPMDEVDRVILHEHVSVSSHALAELLRREIPISFHDASGRYLGSFLPPSPRQAAMRFRQYERSGDPVFALGIARTLVSAKLAGQRRLLQRLQATRPHADATDILAALTPLATEIERVSDLDALRGVEGIAAAYYFKAWDRFLPPDFPFTVRSTRPPLNPVNATLSYAATVLYGEFLAACHRRGLDPGLGTLHTTQDRRWSLPLDLMEPFRPAVAEALTLRLFAHRMLGHQHFTARDGGIFLTPEGRRILLHDFEKRLLRPFTSQRTGQRSSLRAEIDASVLSFKAALDGADFSPFRLL